jgi:3-hydroxyisobutyrate dehydrogenase-like beta-hydroxyacid dehydrogenase
MSQVSCIGLGNMGSALARALLAAGHDVTVWNRTADKATGLVENGARLSETVAGAVAASSVSVVCLRGYEVSLALLQEPDTSTAIEGRVVVQLGGGAPDQVDAVAAALTERGARYLDGSIFGFPESIGSSQCQILVSGDRMAFTEASDLLEALAGDVSYLGERYATAATVEGAAAAFLYAAAQAYIVAAAIGDAAGAPLEGVTSAVSHYAVELLPVFDEFAAMISAGEYGGQNLRLASGIENLGAIIAFGRGAGVDVEFLEAAHRSFLETAKEHRSDSLAAVFETLRYPRP